MDRLRGAGLRFCGQNVKEVKNPDDCYADSRVRQDRTGRCVLPAFCNTLTPIANNGERYAG